MPRGSLCRFCGRSKCRCGEPYPYKLCSKHGQTMKIVSIASRSPLPGKTEWGWNWFEAIACSRPKCTFMRPLKRGQGVPRNENRKTKTVLPADTTGEIFFNKAGVECIRTKFGAQVRTVVVLKTPSKEARGLPVRVDALQRTPRKDDKGSSQTARAMRCQDCGILHGGPCAKYVNAK